MNEFKKFKRPGDVDIVITTTSGAGCRISKDWTPVVDGLWSLAYAAGAISEDMTKDSNINKIKALQEEEEVIREAKSDRLKSILNEIYDNPNGNVDKSNTPLMRKVIAKFGEAVPKDVVDATWQNIIEERGK